MLGERLEIRLHAFKDFDSQLFPGQFSSAELESDFDFIPFAQKPLSVAQLDLVIVLLNPGADLNFLDLNGFLFLLQFCLFFLGFIAKFSIIKNLTNRGINIGRHFHQIKASRSCAI